MLTLLVYSIELSVCPLSQISVLVHQEGTQGALGQRFSIDLAKIKINIGKIAESITWCGSYFALESQKTFFPLTEYVGFEPSGFFYVYMVRSKVCILQVSLDCRILNAQ